MNHRYLLIIVVGIVCINILNLVCMAIYCRIERNIELKKRGKVLFRDEGYENENGGCLSNDITKKQLAKKIYKWINPYFYGWIRYNILVTGRIPSYRIRKVLYKIVYGMKLAKGTVVFGGCEFRSPWNIKLGNCTIGANCILDGRGGLSIDDDVVLGSGVHIWTMNHSINDPYFRTLEENIASVEIKRHAWIASDSVIQPGVIIGEGVVLASKAVATKDCEPFGVYGGIPAKRIAERNRDLKYKLDGKVTWHFM